MAEEYNIVVMNRDEGEKCLTVYIDCMKKQRFLGWFYLDSYSDNKREPKGQAFLLTFF